MHFESISYNELLDSSGYGHHGINHDARQITDEGPPPGKAMEFNAGEEDYIEVDVPESSPLNLETTSFTIAAWIKLHSDKKKHTIFFEAGDWGGTEDKQKIHFFTKNRHPKLGFYGYAAKSSRTVPLNQWTHVAVTFDRGSNGGDATFYINGVGETPKYIDGLPDFGEWRGVLLGRANFSPYSGGAYLNGLLDEVHVYRRVLNETEVDYIYDQETSLQPWFYGVNMAPPYNKYNSILMPTSGMDWTSPPVGSVFFFWVSAKTRDEVQPWGDEVWTQCGFVYNGWNTLLQTTEFGTILIPPHSWGMFWAYEKYGLLIGDNVLPLPGWAHTDRIYFSIAVFPTTGGLAFMFTNMDKGYEAIVVKVSSIAYEPFYLSVKGLVESWERSGFGDIYVDRIEVWAQIWGERSCGPGYVYDANTAPYSNSVLSSVWIHEYADNDVQVGFFTGSHYPGGEQLWSSTYYDEEELYPPDP